jgi:hypothetical protein
MSLGAITMDPDATITARNGKFIRIEIGGDRSCSVVIGSRLAVDFYHTDSGGGAVYDRYDYLSEKRDALTRLDARLADIVPRKRHQCTFAALTSARPH